MGSVIFKSPQLVYVSSSSIALYVIILFDNSASRPRAVVTQTGSFSAFKFPAQLFPYTDKYSKNGTPSPELQAQAQAQPPG
jgi:hypothetical protein